MLKADQGFRTVAVTYMKVSLLNNDVQFSQYNLFDDMFCVCTAMQHLDKLKLWGKNIKCSPSKHTMVQLPKEGQPVSSFFSSFQLVRLVVTSPVLVDLLLVSFDLFLSCI